MRSLDDAIVETEKALAEGRNAIQGIRSESRDGDDLAEFLKNASKDFASTAKPGESLPTFDLIEEGQRRSVSSDVNNEVCRIALELLRNAFRHAQATRIEAEIRYDAQMLRLRIRDNGKGIDPVVLREGGVAGHWGLKGVRERAERIGAKIEFWSDVGLGTEIQVTVPAGVAYQAESEERLLQSNPRTKSRAKQS